MLIKPIVSLLSHLTQSPHQSAPGQWTSGVCIPQSAGLGQAGDGGGSLQTTAAEQRRSRRRLYTALYTEHTVLYTLRSHHRISLRTELRAAAGRGRGRPLARASYILVSRGHSAPTIIDRNIKTSQVLSDLLLPRLLSSQELMFSII